MTSLYLGDKETQEVTADNFKNFRAVLNISIVGTRRLAGEGARVKGLLQAA